MADIKKDDLVNYIAEQTELTKTEVTKVIDVAFEFIAKSMAEGDKLSIPGFGKFSQSERAAREGRNPQTGETIQIKAAKVPKFTAAKALKDTVNN